MSQPKSPLQLSISKDKARTWSAPLVVSDPGVKYAVYGGTAVKEPGTLAEIVKPVYAPNGDIWVGFTRDMCVGLGTEVDECDWDVAANTGSRAAARPRPITFQPRGGSPRDEGTWGVKCPRGTATPCMRKDRSGCPPLVRNTRPKDARPYGSDKAQGRRS